TSKAASDCPYLIANRMKTCCSQSATYQIQSSNSTAHLDANSLFFVSSPSEQAAPKEVKDDYRSNSFSRTSFGRVLGRVRRLLRTIRAARTSRPLRARPTQQSTT